MRRVVQYLILPPNENDFVTCRRRLCIIIRRHKDVCRQRACTYNHPGPFFVCAAPAALHAAGEEEEVGANEYKQSKAEE